jgi:hypothetical protein
MKVKVTLKSNSMPKGPVMVHVTRPGRGAAPAPHSIPSAPAKKANKSFVPFAKRK